MNAQFWKHYHPDYPTLRCFEAFGLIPEETLKPHDCPYCNGNQGGHDDCPMCQGTGINPDFIQWDKERLF